MDDTKKSASEELAYAISKHPPQDDEGESKECMIMKFLVVAEWIDNDGIRWLTKYGANGNGEVLAEWDVKGMAHEALFGSWNK